MFTLRCTKKMQQLLEVGRSSAHSMGVPTTRLGDWYANVVVHAGQPHVLFTSERTLLPVVVRAAPLDTLMPRFCEALGELLFSYGVDERTLGEELTAMQQFLFAGTVSRRVLGTMTDFAWLLENVPTHVSLLEAAQELAQAPCSPIAMESPNRLTVAVLRAQADLGVLQ